jgi:hypothetical protein
MATTAVMATTAAAMATTGGEGDDAAVMAGLVTTAAMMGLVTTATMIQDLDLNRIRGLIKLNLIQFQDVVLKTRFKQ